ncbi:hypothetical protein XENORESO_013419 [Xenotaenia resolanae]|uniref:Uncharacterized protein n=1 Tax=Xenotaenia resolanae TaxID=208358 RepID=A0ABV0VWQ1_9TELE
MNKVMIYTTINKNSPPHTHTKIHTGTYIIDNNNNIKLNITTTLQRLEEREKKNRYQGALSFLSHLMSMEQNSQPTHEPSLVLDIRKMYQSYNKKVPEFRKFDRGATQGEANPFEPNKIQDMLKPMDIQGRLRGFQSIWLYVQEES